MIAIIICIGLMFICWGWLVWRLVIKPNRKGGWNQNTLVAGAHHTVDLAEQGDYAPREVDPANPPRWAYYRPKEAGHMAFCSNCGYEVDVGEKVLLFYNPSLGHVEVLCQKCVKVQP